MSRVKKYQPTVGVSSPKLFDVIRTPIVTEKSTLGSQYNQYTFGVDTQATKADIKIAIETIFKVSVLSVNTLNQKGKTKRFKGRIGQRPDRKKAVVRIKEGQTIDLGAGL